MPKECKEKYPRYESNVNLSQIVLMHGGNAIIAGVAEEDKPGSIQVFRSNFEKMYEVQAHSLPVERLRISYDNKYLFSVAQDGVLAMFEIKVNE